MPILPYETRTFMQEIREQADSNLNPEQAAELSLLVDLEAHWENLRKASPPVLEDRALTHDLQGKQKAYAAFWVKLEAYNKRYQPRHIPGLLLNTPSRLGAWCRTMRAVCLQLEHTPQSHCPVHLLEKAYRWADGIGARMNKDAISRSARPDTIGAVIQELGALVLWCDNLTSVAAAG